MDRLGLYRSSILQILEEYRQWWSCKGSDGIIPCGDAEKQLRRASDAMSTLSGRSSREKWNDSYGQAEMDVQGLSTPVCRTPDPAPNQ